MTATASESGRLRVAIITPMAMSRRHGTGAQMLRLFEDNEVDFFHVYFGHHYGGMSEVSRSYLLGYPRWRGRGRRVAIAVEGLLGLNWWKGGSTFNAAKFRAFRRQYGLECDVAYVNVCQEDDARRANAVLDELKVPYVTHVMDIVYPDGFDAASSQLRKLFTGARYNWGLGEAIANEIRKFTPQNVGAIPIGQRLTDRMASPPAAGGPVKLVMVGAVYRRGVDLLADAWPVLKQRVPGIHLLYAGQQMHAMTESLKPEIDDRGYITDKAVYESLLAESHLAYLAGPSELDGYGKFSIPSRTSDYFMAGLPTLMCVPDGTSTRQFLSPLIPQAVRQTLTADQLVQAVVDLAGSTETWRSASRAVRAFSESELEIGRVRQRIFDSLRAAAKGH